MRRIILALSILTAPAFSHNQEIAGDVSPSSNIQLSSPDSDDDVIIMEEDSDYQENEEEDSDDDSDTDSSNEEHTK